MGSEEVHRRQIRDPHLRVESRPGVDQAPQHRVGLAKVGSHPIERRRAPRLGRAGSGGLADGRLARSGAICGKNGTTNRRCLIAHQEGNHLGDRFGSDGVRQYLFGK
jgi:hypothetical protein